MNEGLIERHNSLVKPGDFVFHLGDFSLYWKAVEKVLPRLNGEIMLIAGNHDTHKKYRGFYDIKFRHNIILGTHNVMLSHKPWHYKEGTPDKYSPINDQKSFLIHGHSHSTKESRHRPEQRRLDVGVDGNNYYPLHLDEVKQILGI